MGTLRTGSASFAVGALLCIGPSTAWAYSSPSIGSCSSSSCQIIDATVGNRSAQAIFEVNGSDLFVTLANTSTLDVTDAAFVLTALLFNLNYTDGSAVTLSPLTALMSPNAGSNVSFDAITLDNANGVTCADNCAGSDVVGGEWAYASGATVSDAYSGFTKGIGSAGVGDVFGTINLFAGPNLAGPVSVNGGEFGITSFGDDRSTVPNAAYDPVTSNAVQFKLAMSLDGTKTLNLGHSGALSAGFQYGTTQGVPGTFIPIPGTLALLGLGALGLCWMRRRQAG